MRLCTNCISCMELPLLPKRARFLSEPPPNRLQISVQTTPLPTMIRADGQAENKGKTSRKHLNSFPFRGKGHAAFSRAWASTKRYRSLRGSARLAQPPVNSLVGFSKSNNFAAQMTTHRNAQTLEVARTVTLI